MIKLRKEVTNVNKAKRLHHITSVLKVCILVLVVIITANVSARGGLSEPLSWKKLKKYMEKNNIKTREELLSILPNKFKESIKFVVKSRSSVSSSVSEENPRLVYSDNKTGFTLTISTSLEDKDTRFIEITEPLPNGKIAEPKVIELAEYGVTKVNYIEDPNEYFKHDSKKKCSNCHGGKGRFRYRWPGRYPIWRGVIGENHHDKNNWVSQQKILDKLKKHKLVSKALPDDLDAMWQSDVNTAFGKMIADRHKERVINDLVTSSGIEKYVAFLKKLSDEELDYGTLDDVVESLTSNEVLLTLPEDERDFFKKNVKGLLETMLKKQRLRLSKMKTQYTRNTLKEELKKTLEARGSKNLDAFSIEYVAKKLGLNPKDWAWDPQIDMAQDGYGGMYMKVVDGVEKKLKKNALKFKKMKPSSSVKKCEKDILKSML
ncbi:MAG: hypothetical protein HON90_08930 [Halobacteriovoraceae bacterium]|jgi:hypothetical protein|nr:hypothetical protein [Halobacteriovoraceae bacterium]